MSAMHRLIHGGCRQLGLDEDERRGLYLRLVQKDSLSEMSEPEMRVVADELRRLGASPAKGKRSAKDTVSGPSANVLRAFWLSGYNLGVIRDPDDRAILSFAQSQTGIDHVQWMHRPEDARSVIEAIKAIVRRDANLPDLWRPRRGVPADHYTNDPRSQVIYGQWEILVRLKAKPAVDLFAWVDALNWQQPGYALAFRDRNGPALIDMQRRLGVLIRAARKKGGLR